MTSNNLRINYVYPLSAGLSCAARKHGRLVSAVIELKNLIQTLLGFFLASISNFMMTVTAEDAYSTA